LHECIQTSCEGVASSSSGITRRRLGSAAERVVVMAMMPVSRYHHDALFNEASRGARVRRIQFTDASASHVARRRRSKQRRVVVVVDRIASRSLRRLVRLRLSPSRAAVN